MNTFARLLRIAAVLSCSTLITACMGFGVMAPHTLHRQQTAADKEAMPGLVHTRDEIIARHGESVAQQARLKNGIEQITVKTGRTSCGVLLLIFPILPNICPTRMQYDLAGDEVIATHQQSTRFYGVVCSAIFPILGKNQFCVLFPD